MKEPLIKPLPPSLSEHNNCAFLQLLRLRILTIITRESERARAASNNQAREGPMFAAAVRHKTTEQRQRRHENCRLPLLSHTLKF